MMADLLFEANDMRYSVRLGHALRCSDCKTGKKNSLHKQKLAIDLNLFRDGTYLTNTEDHRPFGEYWESIGVVPGLGALTTATIIRWPTTE